VTDSLPPSAPAVPPETPLYVGRYVVPTGYAKAAARAFGRFQLSRPAVWIPLIVFAAAFAIAAWASSMGGNASPLAPVIFLIFFLAVMIISWMLRTRRLERQLAVNAQPGGVYQVTLTRSFFTMQTPNASSSVRYDYYETLTEQGDFLFLRIRGARARSIVPRGLFTEDGLNLLRARIPQ